ncbi:MAG: nucleotide pyrophosphohydrolase [Patescibacteria group bacterium]
MIKKQSRGGSFKDYAELAVKVKNEYAVLEKKKCGRAWTKEELAQGFVVDVGELMELVMVEAGLRGEKDKEKFSHELCDCLWSVFVLADRYKVDLAKEFPKNMEMLEKRVKEKLKNS